jgi:D-3-phosphoglycerate dehydrogenase
VNVEFLKRHPGLTHIISTTSGFDHIDWQLCASRGIQCAYTPDANAVSASEWTWLLVLSSLRKSRLALGAERRDRTLMMGRELSGLTLGLIGLGRIGQRVARMARAFGLEVLAYDPYQADQTFLSANARRSSWDELIPSSDIVSIHTPLTPETKRLFTARNLEGLAEPCLLVNAARGELLPARVALELLHAHPELTLALDVTEPEPLPHDHPLRREPRCLISPHIAATTHEAFAKAGHAAVDLVELILRGHPLPTPVPPIEDWSRSYGEDGFEGG